ncbi:MAG: NAD(P)H-hydrate dehydratase [Pseudomonadota bacterium]
MRVDSPSAYYTAEQSRAVDAAAMARDGFTGPQLMARAARAAFEYLLEQTGEPQLLQVLCGAGNNGGDGFLLAMLARDRGIETRVFLVDGEPRSQDGLAAFERMESSGLQALEFAPNALEAHGVVVDAMLGTGITGAPRESVRNAIDTINALQLPTLALDVPTGVNSDTGHIAASAIRASWTISFITAKRGLVTAAGQGAAGQVVLDDLDVPADTYNDVGDVIDSMLVEEQLAKLPPRPVDAHKGSYGRLLIVGGDHGMGGAALMAAESALRCGLGLCRVVTRPEHMAPLLTRCPEAMATGADHYNHALPALPWADAIVVGPGLGDGPWGEQMLHACLAAGKPLLIDADALNLLAVEPRALPPGSVITPHPGEAARLLDRRSLEIQEDRFVAVKALQDKFQTAVVLKGNGTLVVDSSGIGVCLAGNPGMASGGMGDVLSGVIGSFLAQGLDAGNAARLGVTLHAAAADNAAAVRGMASLLARDVIEELGALLP